MKLAYRELGEGRPLIILHGLFGQSDNWNTLAKQFAQNGFRVFTVDQRNHGLSPHSEIWTYEAMADDLNELIDEHQLQNPILLGHSMGGKTVMYFEYKYPQVASKLIIADIAAKQYPMQHKEVLQALHAVNFDTVTTRKEVEAVMNTYISDFGTKQFLLKNIYWLDTQTNRMDWRFNLKVISDNYTNVSEAIPHFKSDTPTLIIRGARSHYILDEDWTHFQLLFSNTSLQTIADAAHWVHAEKPQVFYDVVMNFLKN
jgi:esterase